MPEVKKSPFKVTFFKDGGRDMIEVAIIGDPNTLVRKVREQDKEDFAKQWEAYSCGEAVIDWGGTPLTALDASDGVKVSSSFATSLALKGIHNVEMLASLSDISAKALGMGIATLRNRAIEFLAEKERQALAAVLSDDKANDAPAVDVAQMRAEIEQEMRTKIEAEMRGPMEEMRAMLAELRAGKPQESSASVQDADPEPPKASRTGKAKKAA